MLPHHIQGFRRLADVVLDAFNELRGEGSTHALGTGLSELDSRIGGFRRGDLVVVSGPTGAGKSSFVRSVVTDAILRSDAAIRFFSPEASAEILFLRAVSALAGVDSSRIDLGDLRGTESSRVDEALGVLRQSRLRVHHRMPMTADDIYASCVAAQSGSPLDLVAVDYLQLLRDRNETGDDRWSDSVRDLKALARELDVPVLVVSQLNAETSSHATTVVPEYRRDIPYTLAQAADVIIMLAPFSDIRLSQSQLDHDTHLTTVMVVKNHHGPLASAMLRFLPETGAFRSVADRVA